MSRVLSVIDLVLEIYIWILLAAALVSWLTGFKVVSADNRAVAVIGGFLDGSRRNETDGLYGMFAGLDRILWPTSTAIASRSAAKPEKILSGTS